MTARSKRRSNGVGLPVVIGAIAIGLFFYFVVYSNPGFWDELLGSASGSSSDSAPGPIVADFGAGEPATVERVVDGDTIVVILNGSSERVRLLNIDTPESVDPNRPVECLGPEASAFLTGLLPAGTAVTLEYDLEARDQYDRLLAGVLAPDGTLVNASIARAGLTDSLVIGGNDRFLAEVDGAVQEARQAGVGLWAPDLACAG